MTDAPQPRLTSLGALRRLVDGSDDGALYDAVDALGVERALDEVFEAIAATFVPERAGSESGVIQWNVGTSQGMKSYQLVIADGRCAVVRGASEPPRVTLSALLADFLRIASGRRDAMQAYMQRELTASGDVLFARRQQAWFRSDD